MSTSNEEDLFGDADDVQISSSDAEEHEDERQDTGSAPVEETTPTVNDDLFGDADDVQTSSSDGDDDKHVDERQDLAGSPAGSPVGSPVEETISKVEEDLFGDADDVQTSSSDVDERVDERQDLASAPVEETILNAEIPKITVDLGNNIHFVKFPNFLSVEPRPFDPDTYEDEVDEDNEILDEEGRSRLKLKVENTIRWRIGLDEEGNLRRESNAKVVRWSDGSLSLYLGSEVFDVHTHPLQGDHHHLFVRQGTGLQGRSVFRTKLTFRPHSTDSFTHRKMTLSMADKTNKAQNKVKVLPAVGKNPEAVKQELIKKEEERMRASARRESQQRRMRERTHGSGRALSAAFLEPDRSPEEGDVSLSAIKNRYKSGAKDLAMRGGRRPFSDEEEDEDEDDDGSDADSRSGGARKSSGSSKPGPSKRIIDSDEDDETSQSASRSVGERRSFDKTEPKRRSAHVIQESDEDD